MDKMTKIRAMATGDCTGTGRIAREVSDVRMGLPFDGSCRTACVLKHQNILEICQESGIMDTWLLMPEIYSCLIFQPHMSSEEITSHVLTVGAGDLCETLPEYYEGNGFATKLRSLIDAIVLSSDPFPYPLQDYTGMFIYEARPIGPNHIAITFND